MPKKKLRPLGKILLDIEPLLLELADHDIQHGDYYGLLRQYLQIHLQALEENYVDGSRPVFFYGHEQELLKLSNKVKNRDKNRGSNGKRKRF